MDELKNLDQKTLILLKKHKVLYTLIQNIFYTKIINEVQLNQNEKDSTLDFFRKNNQINDNDDYEKWLIAKNLNKEEFENKLFTDEKYKKLCYEKFGHKAESRFLKRKSELDLVVYSLIRLKDPFQAREIHLRLKEKESDFNDLASKCSEGVEKLTRGIIGPIPLSKAHPKIIEVLTSIKTGEIFKPFPVDNWHIILRLESFEHATLGPNMKLQMAKELMIDWIDDQSKSIMNEILRTDN